MRYGITVDGVGMADGRDPAVRLFGNKIPLPEEQPPAQKGFVADLAPAAVQLFKGKKESMKEKANTEVDAISDAPLELSQLELLHCSGSSNFIEDEEKTCANITKESEEPKPERDNKETDTTGEDKILRKPDKVLQCPRCNSMDTKFCYYNNYNVNQPRYFCKNCQRYWTSGGTMRNVPVGAGRRKNKHSSLTYPHPAQAEAPDIAHHQPPSSDAPLKVHGTVLKFGPDAPPYCNLTTSVLNIEEQNKPEEPSSCSSSVTAAKHAENDLTDDSEQKSFIEYQNGLPPLHHLQCFPVPPWAFTWTPSWCHTPMVTAPTFCAPIPFPFVPASLWGQWSLPLMGNYNGILSESSSTSTSNCSGNGSPTLGKHSRDSNSSLWVPKTLRIDDIDEAAKSSIFSVLGIKPDEDGLFRSFSSKIKKGESALHANPAALSRSQAFQETTT